MGVWVCVYVCVQIVFEPDEVVAAVVTCGGLCPGLNTVIREVVASLWCNYGQSTYPNPGRKQIAP